MSLESDALDEISGRFAGKAATAAFIYERGPFRAIKILGADCVVTTEGFPLLAAVTVQQGDVVNGEFTKITHGGTASAILVPYYTALGWLLRSGLMVVDQTTYWELTVDEPATIAAVGSTHHRLSVPNPPSGVKAPDPVALPNVPEFWTLNLDADN